MQDQSFTHLGKPNTGDYFEGNRAFMRAIHPRPLVSQVEIPDQRGFTIVFREDSYDPTTRIRRGRFYQGVQSFVLTTRQLEFAPYPQPAMYLASDGSGAVEFQFAAEQSTQLAERLGDLRGYEIRIGRHPAQTEWRIIDREGLSDGGILYTLRSRSSFGLLPILKDGAEDAVTQAYQ
ncbi:hypothetical protein, partial [Acidiphilium sp.]|uniref:hypothetical protein n=1 Tax=Acidiphilium sp. TaxID=527 RepID=UPI0025855A7F